MKRTGDIDPIEFKVSLNATPASVFRALTSQTELRKWWAPRVIMSRNIVSLDDGREIEMKLLQSEKNHSVRYGWRPMDRSTLPATVITFEIRDLGVSRSRTGEGISLEIIHDGWPSQEDRDAQEKIWKSALPGLKACVEGKKVKSWWQNERSRSDMKSARFAQIKQTLESMESENRAKPERKLSIQKIGKVCQILEEQGAWFIKDGGGEFEIRFNNAKVFSAQKNGNIILHWRDLEKILGRSFKDFTNRLALEQSRELHIGKSLEKIPAVEMDESLLAPWFLDAIQAARENG